MPTESQAAKPHPADVAVFVITTTASDNVAVSRTIGLALPVRMTS